MDLALNNLRMLICHKTKQTKQIMFKQIRLTHRLNPNRLLPLQARVGLRVIAMKMYSTILRSPELEASPSDAV